MSTGFKIFGVFIALTCLFACDKMEDPQLPVELESAGSLEAELMSVTATTATFDCELSRHPEAGKSFRAGIMYSTSKRFTTSSAKRAVIENPVDGNYEVVLKGLTFCTDYYYCTYVYRLGNYELSEVKSFATQMLPVDICTSDIQFDEVTVEGQIHLDETTKGKVSLGFMFSDAEDFSSERTLDSALELDEEGRFSIRVTGLDQGTTYYYSYYVSQGGVSVKGPVQHFVTLSPYTAAFKDMDLTSATDLSAGGTANSYIVTAPGLYKFKAVKGNSDEPVGEVSVVSVLWETFGTQNSPDACELIDATSYKDGYAAVNIPQNFKPGNAVVVARDDYGTILWSWHIWLTPEYPKEHVYANGAGVMMDRNLGALSTEKGDPKGFGLLYQWGRKDPFPGSANLNGSVMAKTTAKVYAAVSSPTEGTIDFSVKNPATMIFAGGGKSSDWLYYDDPSKYDNTRWQSVKTMYDPCPPGWRVPDGGADGVWCKAGIPTGAGFPYPQEDYALAGINIPAQYCGENAWYPAAGSISAADGTFVDVGWDGVYWSVTPCGARDVYGFNFYHYRGDTGYVYHSAMLTRSIAASVRCGKI